MDKSGFLKENISNADLQKVVRELVVESERKYKILVENSLVAIVIYCENKFVYINPRVSEILGYQQDDFDILSAWDIVHPKEKEKVQDRARRRLDGEKLESQYETKLLKKNGSTVDVLLKSARMNYNGKQALVIHFADISDVKNAQREIRELSKIIETAQIPIIKIDTKGYIKYINKSAEKFLKANMDYYQNKTIKSLLTGIDPEEMQEHIISQTQKGGFDQEILCKRSDDAPIKMRMTTSPLVDDNNEMSAIACFLVNPAIHEAEENLLNAD
jgi:PAS domain S-box-containing protein